MNKRDFFFYNSDGFQYWCDPVFHTEGGRLHITGVSLFDKDGQYMGFWPIWNMPLEVVGSLKRWTKFNRSKEIADSIGRWERAHRQPSL